LHRILFTLKEGFGPQVPGVGTLFGAWKQYENVLLGFRMLVPDRFTLMSEDSTVVWTFQPVDETGAMDKPLSIYVNYAPIPGVDSKRVFDANKGAIESQIAGNGSVYDFFEAIDPYDNGAGSVHGFWYKESPKSDPDEIHRWHAGLYGNEAAYTVGCTGAWSLFEAWGPAFEAVIHEFVLVPVSHAQ
jgi:hypothetical protein